MVESSASVPSLRYLDPDLFEPSAGWDLDKLLDNFECAICNGIVLKPVQCGNQNCSMLYCQGCVDQMKGVKTCPRRCGSQQFNPVNKLVIKHLNPLNFKCQYSPECSTITQYEKYEKHIIEECEVAQQLFNTPCDRQVCLIKEAELHKKVKDITEKLEENQIQIEEKAKMIEALRQNNQELKSQIKNQGSQGQASAQLMEKINQLQEQLGFQESLSKRFQAKADQLTRELAITNEKLMQSQKPQDQMNEQIKKCTCPNGHLLKPSNSRVKGQSISCDICLRSDIQDNSNFFFRCDMTCDFDLCPCCYYLDLTGKKDKLKEIHLKAKGARMGPQNNEQEMVIQGLRGMVLGRREPQRGFNPFGF